MKKIIVALCLLAALLLTALGTKAQDTVWSIPPRSNYMITDSNWAIASDTGVVGFGGGASYTRVGHYFFTDKETVQIYGIAAMLEKLDFGTEFPDGSGYYLSDYFIDTTLDNALEYVAIYAAGPDSISLISEQKAIHCRDSVPAYYLGTNMYNPSREHREREIHAVYEVFFNEPLEVMDSFYVTMTRQSFYATPDDTLDRVWSAWPIGPVIYGTLHSDSTHVVCVGGGSQSLWINNDGLYRYRKLGYLFLYPILMPPDTTHADTIIGGDTTHVDTVGIATLLERYTALQPNPAAERVLVTSSFGLQGVELYNAAGVKVYEQQATGYSAILDVSGLPAGPYLVRIATPAGTVTKKLVVRRR